MDDAIEQTIKRVERLTRILAGVVVVEIVVLILFI